MHKRFGSIQSFVVLLVIVGFGLLIWWQQLAIVDWFKLRGYVAPNEVVALASDTTMTPKAAHIFYVNHPDLQNQSAFNQNCPAGSEQTIVIGCYHPNQQGIYIYNVTDARLNGVEQVTAAHEMLHAAYDRLSTKERTYVDGLLEDYYKNDLHDQRILSTIAAYQKSEPHDVVNEMHSVFGTEITSLPPALETYYKQYFTDRTKVAAFAGAYQSEFVSREDQVAQDDAQLAKLKSEFTADENDLQTKGTELQNIQNVLNTERNDGNIQGYNSLVPQYNAKVNAYNAEITVTKNLIDQYNHLVTARNALALQEQQLEQALNSHFQPAPQQ